MLERGREFACARDEMRGRRGRRGDGGTEAPAANPLFMSSRPLISMQMANIHDRVPVKCQPMKILLTFRGN